VIDCQREMQREILEQRVAGLLAFLAQKREAEKRLADWQATGCGLMSMPSSLASF
jgi:hypothetical protein